MNDKTTPRLPEATGTALMEAALAHAAAGRAVFPCGQRKEPLVGLGGFKLATTDPEQIKEWWTKHPNALIGSPVAPGEIVLDADPRHGARMDDWPFEFPETRTTWTGGADRGRHFFFADPGVPLSQTALTDAIHRHTGRPKLVPCPAGTSNPDGTPKMVDNIGWDLRAPGKNYVILPGSIHPETGRVYEDDGGTNRATPMPKRMVDMLRVPERPTPTPTAAPRRDSGQPITGGTITGYNARTTFTELLAPRGWELVGGDGETDGSRWRHPTATSALSATVRNGRLYNYSTGSGLPMAGSREGGMSPFDLMALLHHNGDQAAALEATRAHTATKREDWLPTNQPGDQAPNVAVTPARSAPGEPTNTSAELWDAHPVLADIRRFARARGASSWALLGCLITRCLTATHPGYRIPPIILSHASLNAFLAVVGASGVAKTGVNNVSYDYMTFDGEADTFPVGSGEGIAALFLQPDPDAPKGRAGMVRNDRIGALMTADEVDTLAALGSRSGATLGSVLRTAWSGGQLGQTNGDPTRSRSVARDSYRLGLIVGVQPTRAAVLIDDGGAGTPQRFLWCPAADPTLQRPTEAEKAWARTRARTTWTLRGDQGPDVRVCEAAIQLIEDTHYAKMRGETPPLDGHALLCRLKVATGLALLCTGRFDVTDEWWALSGDVMSISEQTRAGCVTGIQQARLDAGSRAGEELGARSAKAAEVADQVTLARIAGKVVAALADGPRTARELDRLFAGRDKRVSADGSSPFREALQTLADAGTVIRGGGRRGDQVVQVLALPEHGALLTDEAVTDDQAA